MKLTQSRGYSSSTAKQVLSDKPIQFVGPTLEAKYVWKDGQPTNQIQGYATWFVQEGLPPFTVKFTDEVKLPNFLQEVEFTDLEACEVRNNVYFRAKGLKELK